MSLDNKLRMYHSVGIDMSDFLKENIATELELAIEDVYFTDIANGFEFTYNGETEGTVRITFSELTGTNLLIEATDSWDAVEIYNLIYNWIDEWTKANC